VSFTNLEIRVQGFRVWGFTYGVNGLGLGFRIWKLGAMSQGPTVRDYE
jgi:hypothetical protein